MTQLILNEQKLNLNDENSKSENVIKTSSNNNAEIAEENEQVRELKKKSEIEKESKIKSIQELGVSKNNSIVVKSLTYAFVFWGW